MKTIPEYFAAAAAVTILMAATPGFVAAAESEGLDLFETRVRPVLATRCVSCHGAERQDGGIRLDSREMILAAALVDSDKPDESRLIRAVRGELEAPQSCHLKNAESAALARWIGQGMPWPKELSIASENNRAKAVENHWAFQPVRRPEVPDAKPAAWIRTPVDAFILQALRKNDLAPSREADRRNLIRRLSYTLTGLPPTPQAVAAFVNDADPEAYTKLVDRLLDSPHYGEHWARHWLDVARYSDTKGYVYAREERFWTHAWTYRDWVVRALNEDLAYDRFLLLQLAADQAAEGDEGDLAAMGFLTLGRRFLGVQREIIDDRIDVVMRGTMALTVGCARCHDHKYDPIPTADYYSLHGVFSSSREKLLTLGDANLGGEAFQKELKKLQQTQRTTTATLREETSALARKRVGDYLIAQTELEKYPANGFDQIFQKTDLLPAFAHRWADYLRDAAKREDPVFVPWHAYAALSEEGFAKAAASIRFEADNGKVNPIVARAFQTPPASFDEVIERYSQVLAEIDAQWQAELAKPDPPEALPDPAAEALRRLLYGPGAPCEVPDDPIVHSEVFFDSGSVTKLYKLEGELYRLINKAKADVPCALVLEDRTEPVTSRVFIRGNPLKKGDDAPRQFLALLAGEDRQPFKKGSGRLEMAQAIVDPGNPLTARVIVNRVWGHHFGYGLVTTPSDFGLRADPPSHPELLDWLAARFVAEGWSLKKLHRWMLLSATFRQSSQAAADDSLRKRAREIDPSNRLLWRMNPQRLSWEQFRDSMLAASDDLDRRLGGRPAKMLTPPYLKRRSLYGLIDRQYLPVLLRTFDFANPDLHIPKRARTTVPQQALFFMNHPLVLERVRALAAYAENNSTSADEKVRLLFRQAWQRDPSSDEADEALALVKAVGSIDVGLAPATAGHWRYGYGELDEESQRVSGFTELPHLTGSAWQGGEKWPDAQLGWVQLTAQGGHPGNDRKHAAIRRWTAPRAMTLAIHSKLIHEPAPGDGIRAFIISSRVGKLAAATIHQKTIDLNIATLGVEKGETIDFLVDIGEILNSDQYLWNATLAEAPGGESSVTWNSQADFPHDITLKLSAWEQLAQTLLCSNEFLFVD